MGILRPLKGPPTSYTHTKETKRKKETKLEAKIIYVEQLIYCSIPE
jgi:hypothetical protein